MKIPLPSKPYQIVTLQNNRPLLPKVFVQEVIDKSFSNPEASPKPDESLIDVVIDNQQPHRASKLLSPKKYKASTNNQKIRIYLIDKEQTKGSGKFDPQKRLYLQFINYKERIALESFILKNHFTIFPTIKELSLLWKKYNDKKIEMLVARETEFSEVQIRESYIQQTNIDFAFKKQKELKRVISNYQQGTFTYKDLVWLNRELEGVSYILIDQDYFLFKKTKGGKRVSLRKPLSKVIENIALAETKLQPVARVYGHFSYCCYELFLDILKRNRIAICPYCYDYFTPTRKGHNVCDKKSCKQKMRT
ncbi:MAG: hypothetical protein KIH67_001785 [Candidatus Moranbacteria bacterium]|nr:hypothetical protein [Candidatus Moranbacteria bacterium]